MRRNRAMKRSRSWTNRDFLERDTGHSCRKRRRCPHINLPFIEEERENEDDSLDEKKSESIDSDYKDDGNCGGVVEGIVTQEEQENKEEKIDEKGDATGEEKADEMLLSIFECPVCKQLLHNPVTLKCGHSLCEDCMMQYLENGTGRCKCPAGCQTVIPFFLPPINITLKRALGEKCPNLTRERGHEINHEMLSFRRDLLADASAICSVLPQGSEGRQLEIVRREIRLMRLQNQQALQIGGRRGGRGRGGNRTAAAGAHRQDEHELLLRRGGGGGLPLTAKWMLIMMVFTVWSLVDTKAVAYLKLDWNKVSKGEFWRLATTFFSLGNRSNLLRSVFSLLRLYFLKPFEPTIGTKRYGTTLIFGVIIMLIWSYMNQATGVKQQQDDELNDSGFLSHWLIWHMFVYYCLEKPLLFLVLLWLVQLEAFVQAPLQNLTMFLMMLSPRIPYIAIILYKNLNNYMFHEEQRREELFHVRTRVVLRG